MTQQTIITTPANSGQGDSLQVAFNKCNSNFNDLYGVGGSYIASLPVAGNLAGTELLVLSASGVPESATTAQIAALAVSIIGAPNTSPSSLFGVGSFSGNLINMTATPQLTGGGLLEFTTNSGVGSGNWSNLNGTYSAQQVNGAGTNLSASVGLGIQTSGTGANSLAETSTTLFNPSGPSVPLMRATSNGLGIAGFTFTMYFNFIVTQSVESIFFGFCTSISTLGNIVPSALLNTLGLGKDSGDTNLSWYYNGSSGSATKVSLGVTPASLANQLLRLVITADPLGNCVMTLTNMESGGSQISTISLPTATAKLPVTNQLLAPHLYTNNTSSGVACSYGVQYIFITAGFMA